ncbi:MAG: carbon-phosphorus lyase complex subunit PhnI [Burkholderiales bacterium]|nr:carbon-phosphorus lyase complex subunit PhnI [Burkholderiales bacterium]
MALVDRALQRAEELGEAVTAPAQMEEFVLASLRTLVESLRASCEHLKLPHYVDFQSGARKLVRQPARAGRGSAPAVSARAALAAVRAAGAAAGGYNFAYLDEAHQAHDPARDR